MTNSLTIALTKGRILKETLPLLASTGDLVVSGFDHRKGQWAIFRIDAKGNLGTPAVYPDGLAIVEAWKAVDCEADWSNNAEQGRGEKSAQDLVERVPDS